MNTEKIIDTFDVLSKADLLKNNYSDDDYLSKYEHSLPYENFIIDLNKTFDNGKNQTTYKIKLSDDENTELFTISVKKERSYSTETTFSIYINNTYLRDSEQKAKLLSSIPLDSLLEHLTQKANAVINEKISVENKNESEINNENLVSNALDRIKALRGKEKTLKHQM